MSDYKLNMTGDLVKKILDGRLHSPIQDVVGDNWKGVDAVNPAP